MKCPKIIRRNLTGLVVFPISSGFEHIYNDIRSYFANKDEFNSYVQSCVFTGKVGDCLYISMEACLPKILRLRKNFTLVNTKLMSR